MTEVQFLYEANFSLNIYINDLIKDLDYIDLEILAYAYDLCVLCQDKNELIRVIKRIDL